MSTARFHEHTLTSAVRRGIWAVTSLALPGWAIGAPVGGQVVAGSAAIAQAGTKTTITQSTAKGAINWQSFSIGTNEYVQFVQPGSTSVTLNRVVGNDPSQLLGQMSANGQIFLVNPSGVYFGANARIDVAGLVATTFDIADDDFMAGRYQFSRVDGRDPAQVINDGTITANGGYVVLAGDGVQNHGLIEAYLGDIVMAAGERVGLDLGGDGLISFSVDGDAMTEIAGVENTGELYADGGRVFLTAQVQGDLLSTAVNHDGLIQARTVEEREGMVYLGGVGGDVMVAGVADADAGEANADGGRIIVRSDRDITLRDGALVSARGEGSGKGGSVRLIASELLDIESMAAVTTQGGEAGSGGFIEVSGHGGVRLAGDLSPGPGGEVLVDPIVLTIRAGSGSPTTTSFESVIYQDWVEGLLNNDTNVTLVASETIQTQAGCSGCTFGGGITATSGTGDLTLAIGSLSYGASQTLGDPVGGDCFFGGACGDGTAYQLNLAATGSFASIFMFDSSNSRSVNVDMNGEFNILMRGGSVTLGTDVTARQGVFIGDPTPDGLFFTQISNPQANIFIRGETVTLSEVFAGFSFGFAPRVELWGNTSVKVIGSGLVAGPAPSGSTFQPTKGSLDIHTDAGDIEFIESFIFSGDRITVRAGGGGDILMNFAGSSGNSLIAAGNLALLAQGSVIAGPNNDIEAYALNVQAGDRIDLSGVSLLTVFEGLTGIGDAGMIQQLADLGAVIPPQPEANAVFIAPTEVSLGPLTFWGDYLYFQTDSLTLNQTVLAFDPLSYLTTPTTNTALVVQMLPFTQTRGVGIETTAPGAPATGVTYFTQANHFGRFTGTSILVGGTGFAGPMTIGQGGVVNIGGKNFVATTTGTVAGAGNIVSTGLISIAGSGPPSIPPSTLPTGPINTGAVNTVVQQNPPPGDPGSNSIPPEAVEANVPPEEQTGAETTPEGPVDPVAILEQQPLIGGQVEVNNTVLTCQ